jgi:hypothetical protein
MAILQGFPPSNTISPSVRITELDLSFITPAQSFNNAGLIGFASKGPINVPTLIASQNQLNTVFGYPHPESGDPYMYYAAVQYLQVGNGLYIVRVGDTDNVSDEMATIAAVAAPSAGGQIDIVSATSGPYVFAVDSFFRWSLNGILASKSLVVLAGTYATDQLVEELNAQVTPDIDGIQFYNTNPFNEGEIAVMTTFSFGPDATLELVSVQDAMYGGPVGEPNVTGWGTGMTKASLVGSLAQYPAAYQTAGNYDFTGLTGMNLQVVIDGTDNVLIDNVVQVIDLSGLEGSSNNISAIVTYINNQLIANGGTLPGGFTFSATGNNLTMTTDGYGEDARFLIKSDSTAAGIFGFATTTQTGLSPSGTSGTIGIASYGIVNGDSNTTGAVSFTLTADSAGIDGNATQVVITNNVSAGNFIMQIFNNGTQVESWGALVKDQASSFYVETYLALVSDWVRVTDNTSNPAPPMDGTYTLSGGSDGIPSDPDDQDTLLIGSSLGYTGLYSLSEPDQIDIDLVAVPGHASTAVVLALLDLSQNWRQDCLAIIDAPFGLTVNEIIAWQNGTHPLNTTRFDSDFGALYWPWLKQQDLFNNIAVWVPPSGSVMATIAQSDNIAAPWFAPAGVNRGVVTGVTDVFSRPTLAERDLMYGYSNCINPIVQFVDFQGFVIWGQKTLQRTPTALDRVNVRRLMFYIEKEIRVASRQLLFEPHDATLEAQFVRLATAILSDVQVGRGITDFRVVCDATLNTPNVIDRNELRANIGVMPTRAVEFIFIEFVINSTGNWDSSVTGFTS